MSLDSTLTDRLKKIRLILTDVDGVLTDGRLAVGAGGHEVKFFSIYDGLGIRLAQQAGLEVGFVSGRRSRAVTIRARELGVKLIAEGSTDKASALAGILRERSLEAEQVAYIGDDLPDLQLLRRVGFAAAPANAAGEVKDVAHYVTVARGGKGVLREIVELILKTQGQWETVLERFRGAAHAGIPGIAKG